MVLNQSQQQQTQPEQQQFGTDNYGNHSFSRALHDLISIDTTNSNQREIEDSNKFDAHLSNTSSLVTSLSSSREGSPEKNGFSMLFGEGPSSVSDKFISSSSTNSWIPSLQLKPAVTMTHLPLYAAWTDA